MIPAQSCNLTLDWTVVGALLAITAPRIIADVARTKDVLNGGDS